MYDTVTVEMVSLKAYWRDWRKAILRPSLWRDLCKKNDWIDLERTLLEDLTVVDYESDNKYRRLYHRADQLRRNWKNGEFKCEIFIYDVLSIFYCLSKLGIAFNVAHEHVQKV